MRASAIYQIVGYKNTGKTHLMCRLITYFQGRGTPVATIKRDGHEFDADPEGSDTRRHREAGAAWSAITSQSRTAIVKESASTLLELADEAPRSAMLLVEGFKREPYPKLVTIRCQEDEQLLRSLTGVTAVAVWPDYYDVLSRELLPQGAVVFPIDDTTSIARHIQASCEAIFD